ncbi:hypothetical protein LCGC14_2302380, partial [marine sediment metagenome]
MGEQAEYMLSGEDCAGCGEYIGADAGMPCYCSKQCFISAGYPKEDWPDHE